MPTAKHLTTEELAEMKQWQGDKTLTPMGLWEKHKQARNARREKPQCLTAFRKALRGRTYNRSEETRGRKRSLGPRAIAALDKTRRELVLKSEG